MSDHTITLTHINIRQSIAILLTKLVVIDIILAVIVIGAYFVLVQGAEFTYFAAHSPLLFLSFFTFIGVCKIFLTIYVVLLWLNEYYEITPESIVHKRGIIFRNTEMYRLSKVREIKVHDTFLGEIFNFATITLYDIRLQKYLDLYLIHNPTRYEKILKALRPSLEVQTDRVHIPFTPDNNE